MTFGIYDKEHNWRTIEDFDSAIEKLKASYEYMQEKVKEMQKTLNEWNKNEEIQKLKEEKEYITSHCFLGGLSDKEIAAIKEFKNKHYKTCCGNGKYKSKGNTWRYEISGTGIGHMIKIQCPECGVIQDITDIDNW